MKAGLFVIVAALVIVVGVAALLYGRWAGTPPGINVNNAELVAQGKALYARECASCHGDRLQGQTRDWRQRLPDGSLPAPPHDASGHTWHHPDELLFEITKFGRPEGAGPDYRSSMPAFTRKLSDAEIWAVLSYIKSRWPQSIQRRHDALNERYRASR